MHSTIDSTQKKNNLNGLQSIMLNLEKEKKLIPKDYVLYNSIYMIYMELQNYRAREQIIGCQKLERCVGGKGLG